MPSSRVRRSLENFWEYFHPTLPIIHRPTFEISGANSCSVLNNVICAIGSKYDDEEASMDECFDSAMLYLDNNLYISETHLLSMAEFQAALLAGYAGLFWGNGERYKWAVNTIFKLVTIAREIGMFQYTPVPVEELSLTWRQFVTLEIARRNSYAIYFIDGQMSTLVNHPPKMSHYEIKHILPCNSEIWEAQNEEAWRLLLARRESSLGELSKRETTTTPGNGIYFLEALQQTLIKGAAPQCTSSFGAMILLLAIHIMIRNMTQFAGILETFSEHPQDPLSRRSQLGNALNGLRNLMPRRSRNDKNHMRDMWGMFEVTLHLAYIHLHLPDTAITSGIVEPTLEATIATAAALTRRPSKAPPGTLFLGNDYRQFPFKSLLLVTKHISAVLRVFSSGYEEGNPLLAYMFYKVSLVTWQVLKALIYKEASGADGENASDCRDFTVGYLRMEILDNIEISNHANSLESFESWIQSTLQSLSTWGVGNCGALSFKDMLMIGEAL